MCYLQGASEYKCLINQLCMRFAFWGHPLIFMSNMVQPQQGMYLAKRMTEVNKSCEASTFKTLAWPYALSLTKNGRFFFMLSPLTCDYITGETSPAAGTSLCQHLLKAGVSYWPIHPPLAPHSTPPHHTIASKKKKEKIWTYWCPVGNHSQSG